MKHVRSIRFLPGFLMFILNVLILIVICDPLYAAAKGEHTVSSLDATTIMEKWKNREKAYLAPSRPTVYLTFDDGPSSLTPKILDVLKEEGVQATFFVLGQSAEKHTDLLKRIVKEGHAIGNHTYDHRYEHLYTSFHHFWTQVQRTNDVIYEATSVQTRLFRAPGGTHGHFDAFYHYYLSEAGFEVYDWNVDAGDARRRGVPAHEIIANVKNSSLHHEMHVLLHDSAGHEETLKALPEIIRYFKEKGYQFQPLTTDVKPVQQSIIDPRWKRTYTLSQHQQTLSKLVEFRQIHDDSFTQTAMSKQEMNGVLLRTWAEQRDGSVSWNHSQRTAYVTFRNVQYIWKLDTQTVERYSLETGRLEVTFTDVEMDIVEGRINIPLTFVQRLELDEKNSNRLEVWLEIWNECQNGYEPIRLNERIDGHAE